MKNQWDKGIHIIRHRGQPNRAQLPDGKWVERQEKLWIPEWGGFVMCASYDSHFLYVLPPNYPGSSIRCTCGGVGVVVGPSGYVLDNSPVGKLVVCLIHAQKGSHLNEGERWV